MELLGLFFAVPVTMLSSAAYTALAIWVFGRWPTIKKVAVAASFAVALLLATEVTLLVVLGPKNAYSRLHLVFTLLHFSVFLLAPPAVANLVLHLAAKKQAKRWVQFVAAAGCCWVACLSILVANIMVDEAITGADAGKPFWLSNKEPNRCSQRAPCAADLAGFAAHPVPERVRQKIPPTATIPFEAIKRRVVAGIFRLRDAD